MQPQMLITKRKASSSLSALIRHFRLRQNKPSSSGATGLIDRTNSASFATLAATYTFQHTIARADFMLASLPSITSVR